ncbi:polyprenyl synthetase family protein [Streptomyces mutabilis]|uniref:polyprenyl synthetase family protein n=1 Tax=Streptomyces mutabilis TaxID=67332 RepID=UPI00177B638D|nr:polyprenyl synthetase family protein [Streptomyces mutabilis]GGQ19636.1 dimethylallyltransferase [Streptomyces mutabilis]
MPLPDLATAPYPSAVGSHSDLAAVDAAILDAVDQLPPRIRTVAKYHLGFSSGPRPAEHRGKALRPRLALAAARCGPTPERAVAAAVSVELLHGFSLLHDDIMDGDRTRRGRAAAWVVHGVPAALLTGDALLTLALGVLADSGSAECMRVCVRMMSALVRGQGNDLAFEEDQQVTVDAYLEMAEGKTGALTGAACELAATLAGAPPVVVEALERFGRHAGTAFQIADDILGIWGDSRRTGKPVGSDLAARKKTLPVVAALHAADPEAGQLRALLDTGVPLTEAQTQQATVLVGQLGGRTTAEAIAQQHLDLALEALQCCDLPAGARGELRTLAHHMAARSR